jgi:fumarate reductase (CoM/CoB) subunit B
MSNLNWAGQILRAVSQDCEVCGLCAAACSLISELGSTPGGIAESVQRGEVSERLLAAIQRCDLCGKCGRDCPAGISPADLFLAARQTLIENGTISPADYDVMLVDRNWHFFSIYRDTYGIAYDDLLTDHCESMFFPGCTLAAYAPELTRAAHGWLQKQGLQLGFSDQCCGKPLASIGLCDEADRHLDQLRAQLAASGAREIITACPNCEAHLRAAQLPDIQVRSLYSLMVEAGMRMSGSQKLTFHDSCPDRIEGKNPQDVRALLSGFPQVEMASRGKDAICCGSGGIVSMIDPELCAARAEQRLAEFSASGADTCVTSCMACSHRLARAGKPGQVRHCLEYAFGIDVDYDQVARNTHLMWEGSQGKINWQRLAGAQILPVKQTGTGSDG